MAPATETVRQPGRMRTELTIDAQAGTLPRFTASGGLAARLTGPHTVHLVSTAMTPLGGDDITVRIRVGAGARLTVRSVAATVALPSRHARRSHSTWVVDVEGDGTLDLDCQPLIVAADAEHHTDTTVVLSPQGTLRLRERAQLGRLGEDTQGEWVGSLHADLGDIPLLRHRLTLSASTVDELTLWRATQSELTYPQTAPGEARLAGSEAYVRMPLAAGGALSTSMSRRLGLVSAATGAASGR